MNAFFLSLLSIRVSVNTERFAREKWQGGARKNGTWAGSKRCATSGSIILEPWKLFTDRGESNATLIGRVLSTLRCLPGNLGTFFCGGK